MNWRRSCAIIIPCFNEARTIARVVQDAIRYLPCVLIVDDGSLDLTAKEAKRAGATVLRHSHNQGKGAALATGLAAAHDQGFTWALAMDGDGQHASSDIPKFFHCAADTGATLIVGNRMQDPDRMPPLRRFVNRWMSRRISARAGRVLPDSQCGFRLIHLPTWRSFALSTRHFEVESEFLMAFVGAQQPIEFVAIEVIYKAEQSKIRPFTDTLRWFRWWRGADRA